MAIGSIAGGGFDSELDPTVCDAQTNCNLTLFMRVFLERIEPAGGAAEGTQADSDGTQRKIKKWGNAEWTAWTNRYAKESQAFWNGRFWLQTPKTFTEFDAPVGKPTHRCNVYCRLRMSVTQTAQGAHHSIKCCRLHPSESTFRSDAGLYSNRDLNSENLTPGSSFFTHYHEVGHILGLGHSGDDEAQCVLSGPNSDPCYGVNRPELQDVMGKGHKINKWHAKPWRERLAEHTSTSADDWAVHLIRFYPRKISEIK